MNEKQQETPDTSIILNLSALTGDIDRLEESLERLFIITIPLRKLPPEVPATSSGMDGISPETTSPAVAKLAFLMHTVDQMRQRVDAVADSFLD